MDIRCSKGTYIRTLIHDMGQKLGTGGVLTSLIRTESSCFTLEDCITLEEAQTLSSDGRISEKLIPVETVFRNCPAIQLGTAQKRMFLNGVRLDLSRIRYQRIMGLHSVYGPEKEFLGVARPDFETMELKVVSFF